ncbi:hypothetical protein HUJ05_004540 [Dendroctonus ponderosae]|nr:hypothetical protein HUJ05_004540 [Dendroctonus ponderosae]
MENFMEWKMMGVQKRMKKDVVPHKFACQKDRNRSSDAPVRAVVLQNSSLAINTSNSAKLEMASGKKWRESDTIKFVELYEKEECLWNFRHPVYKHRNARDKAIQNIIKEMNLPDFGVNELKNKIKNIRSTYQQEVNKIKRSKQMFVGDVMEEYKTNLAWFPIADRFLGAVINGTKNYASKGDDDESSFLQPNPSALCGLVETELSNGCVADPPEPISSYNISIDQIKEEVDIDDYNISQPLAPKKRKMSNHLVFEPLKEAKADSIEVFPKTTPIDEGQKDEWYYFTNNVACQLKTLPLERALKCQKKIVDILTEERIDYIVKQKLDASNSPNST